MNVDLRQSLRDLGAELDADHSVLRVGDMVRRVHRRRAVRTTAYSVVGISAAAAVVIGGVTATRYSLHAPVPPAVLPSPSTAPSPSTTPSPSMTPSPSTTPTTTPPPPSPPPTTTPPDTSTLISADGIGPFVIGRPLVDVATATGLESQTSGLASCPVLFYAPGGQGGSDIVFGDIRPSATTLRFVVLTGWTGTAATQPRTASGVTLGTTKEGLVAAYPTGSWTPPNEFDPTPFDVYVTSIDGSTAAFSVQDGVVTGIAVGTDSFASEYCG